jgi:hypothetical protein
MVYEAERQAIDRPRRRTRAVRPQKKYNTATAGISGWLGFRLADARF